MCMCVTFLSQNIVIFVYDVRFINKIVLFDIVFASVYICMQWLMYELSMNCQGYIHYYMYIINWSKHYIKADKSDFDHNNYINCWFIRCYWYNQSSFNIEGLI